ncbi:hypothetical protein [Flavobacterium sp.]|uniref:hypothetical protein n=1 Tax=Flavobacterium sp. TaxID=239 RepID=UPI0028BD1545|nr:hypothetical protein [Flavobacterium sp.]
MKTSTNKKSTPVNSLLIFLASFGIGFALINEFVFDRPKRALLAIMICLLVVGIASKKRQQAEK